MDYQEALSSIEDIDKKFEHNFISYMRQQLNNDYAMFYPDCQIYRISSGIGICCRRYDESMENPDNLMLIDVSDDCPLYVKYDKDGDGLGDGFHILNGDYQGWYIYDDGRNEHNLDIKIDQIIDMDAFELLSNKTKAEARLKELEELLSDTNIPDDIYFDLESEMEALENWLDTFDFPEQEEEMER